MEQKSNGMHGIEFHANCNNMLLSTSVNENQNDRVGRGLEVKDSFLHNKVKIQTKKETPLIFYQAKETDQFLALFLFLSSQLVWFVCYL